MKQLLKIALLGVSVGLLQVNVAEADLIATIDGSDCAGAFSGGGTGQGGFGTCALPDQYDPNNSPVIIKLNPDGTVSEINDDLFPSIDGSEFTVNLAGNTWSYDPGPGDPVINFFVVKGGNSFGLFSNLGDPLADNWNGTEWTSNESHLTFYDTGTTPVPEPASLVLLGSALTGLVARAKARRRPTNKQ